MYRLLTLLFYGVYQANTLKTFLVRSYRTFAPLPSRSINRRFISVALSSQSPTLFII
uniref:hypothetical protein n=1 Tax=Polyopes affinis TaxID=194519 RepID=UPI002A83F38C|nr:hypothetical protein NDC12_pgp121 [Polyopes affinis]WOL37015.1 hypothetical protein [Polyopes affinis]